MSDLHIWTGLLLGWILYAMFLTGTVAYFRDEMSQWMRPELAAQAQVPDAAEVVQRLADTMSVLAPDSPQWSFTPPGARNNVASASWANPRIPGRRGFASAVFDPATGQKVEARDTAGGDFFYRFHFQFHYMPVPWGRWLAGLCAMFMLVAIVSGVITHKKIFVDFFTFRWGKGQRSWLDAHNALSVFGLPFHLMITYSGLVTLMLLYMPWGSDAAFRTPAERQTLTAQMNANVPAGKSSGEKAALAPIADMMRQAQARWGRDNIGRVTVTHPGDAAARVVVVRGDFERVSTSPQYLLFDGVKGSLLQARDRVGAAAETRGVVYALHLGRFADPWVRWLYFLVSLAGTAMVGTGLVLWTVKRRARLPDPERPHFGFRLVERLNIAGIAGLSIAMVVFLWGNRLLPAGLPQRGEWEIHLFFAAWAVALAHALLRPAKQAWLEQLWLAAALLVLLPVLNALSTERGLFASLAAGDWVFAGFDLTLLALGGLHAALAVRAARHRPRGRAARRGAEPDATPARPRSTRA
ncbi:PepSY domain-containing protein [Verticiella sediminum]|uniref:PepSY domain-containing protein n=2 Tax=Verticiella sediminum TaxID=1247510 RepID=A0A556A996_9BURK|nr:PepSY domain-containing protein [Verticiella sediminum]